LSQAVYHFLDGGPLPPSACLITFDDGYRNVCRNGLPILRSLGVPCVLFPVAGVADMSGWLLPALLGYYREDMMDFGQLKKSLGTMPAGARRKWLRENFTREQLPECDYSLASWDELRGAIDGGLVEIGSHTMSHELLTTCDNGLLNDELA